jgi:uncharacterized protein (TIGR03083 family)
VAEPDHRHLLEVATGILAGVSPGDLDAPVSHLPGWKVQELIGHAGWVMRYVTMCLGATPEAPPRRSSVAEPPPGRDVLPWFAQARSLVLARLEEGDPQRPVPTFTGPQPASWWLRRLSHEMTMHRWDLQSALGAPEPIDPALACDGIDEVLEVIAPRRLDLDRLQAAGQVMHLHATDVDGEWLCTLGPDSVSFTHGHAKGDVAARGPISDLLLLLWGRIPPSRVQVFGDGGILERWQAAAAF